MAKKTGGRPRTKNGFSASAPSGSVAGTTAGSNTAVRSDIQRKAFAAMWDADREIAALKARHIAPVQEHRNKIWKDVRNDLGMEAADLKPLYALYKRDREVSEFDDADKAARSQDALREAFQTLATGSTLDFLDALGGKLFGKDGTARDADPPEMEGGLIEASGFTAGKAGKASTENPWDAGTPMNDAWQRGWLNGQAEKVHEELGGGAAPEQSAAAE